MYASYLRRKTVPNPQGNPNIKKYGFKTERTEALTANLSMRIAPSMLKELRSRENWKELVRNAIAKELAKDPEKSTKTKQDLQSA